MKELRHTPERNAIRAESFRESQKRGVFVDEFRQENPHVGMGSCRPATKGSLVGKCILGGSCKGNCSRRK